MSAPLLSVRGLTAELGSGAQRVTALRAVDFDVRRGEITAIVGESGSGKSTAAMALARLNEGPQGAFSGEVRFDGMDVLSLNSRALRSLRGQGIAMVFQDAAAALNPCETIGDQIAEAMVVHKARDWRAARAHAIELLGEVGMPEPARRAGLYPHEMSGGQRQRAMIALGLACDPALLIADEPTTALDVTVQGQILALLKSIVARRDMGLILITHDLGVVAALADQVLVMYAGRIVEAAPVAEFFDAPHHPYSGDMITAASVALDAGGRLATIPGRPPHSGDVGESCAYAPRCARASNQCRAALPSLEPHGTRRRACFHPLDDA
ncbi:ABC transporter ATP-binding protein [uncultured Marivita sp.]|uniref:ABC transporter ATP-binding protein n=1 Tax=uncultured Marivita sp. TaxID=888080 RepID=UPI00260F88A1|nr:ABC transporter ATP-binding protein [uncultured Marivita sp.]